MNEIIGIKNWSRYILFHFTPQNSEVLERSDVLNNYTNGLLLLIVLLLFEKHPYLVLNSEKIMQTISVENLY